MSQGVPTVEYVCVCVCVCVCLPFLRLFCTFEGSLCFEFFNQSGVCGDFLLCRTGKADGTSDAPVFLCLSHLCLWMLMTKYTGGNTGRSAEENSSPVVI